MTEEQKRNHARVLNVNRRHLTPEQRDKVAQDMRMDGMTIPAIAESLGVGVGTVHRALENSQFPNGKSEIVNARGQTRPATYTHKPAPPPTMFDPGESADLELRQIRQMEAPHVYG